MGANKVDMHCSCHDGTDVVAETFTCACPTTPATENIATADIAAECAAICDPIKDADGNKLCTSEADKHVKDCKPCADCHAAIDATKDGTMMTKTDDTTTDGTMMTLLATEEDDDEDDDDDDDDEEEGVEGEEEGKAGTNLRGN